MNDDDGYFVLWERSFSQTQQNVSEIIKVSSTKYSLPPSLCGRGDLKFEVEKQSRRDNHKDQVERKRKREREREREKEREPDRK